MIRNLLIIICLTFLLIGCSGYNSGCACCIDTPSFDEELCAEQSRKGLELSKRFEWCGNNLPEELEDKKILEQWMHPIDSQRENYNCCYKYLLLVEGVGTMKEVCWYNQYKKTN